MLKGILWDNDGVLVNTETEYFEANREVLGQHGVELTHRHFMDWFLTDNCGAWHLLHEKGYDGERVAALRGQRNALYGQRLASGRPLAIPGMLDVVQSLAPRVPMGIVTSSRRDHFETIHRGLDYLPHFRFVVTEDMVRQTKPAPEPYLLGLEKLGIAARECVAVEDSPRGLQAARAAGLRCLVLRHPLFGGVGFEGAHLVLDTPAQLLHVLEQLLAE